MRDAEIHFVSRLCAIGGRSIAVSGSDLFILNSANGSDGIIEEYTTSGSKVKASLVSGLVAPRGMAVSGSDIFVLGVNLSGGGIISEYTTSGSLVSTSLATTGTNTNQPEGIAVVPGTGVPATPQWALWAIGFGIVLLVCRESKNLRKHCC